MSEEKTSAPLAVRDAVLSAMSEGVVLLDAGSNVVYANNAAQHLLGGDDVTSHANAIRAGSAGSGDGASRSSLEVAGRSIEVTTLAAPMPGSTVVVLRDVTEQRRLETVRRDFVANASHELKTPVASILAVAGALRVASSSDGRAFESLLERLEQEAERLAKLVRDLLELSRFEEHTEVLERISLRSIVAEVVDGFSRVAADAGIDLTSDLTTDAHVMGAARDLSLLVKNLLDNAVRFTLSGGDIVVSLRATADTVELTVRDTGIGIPAADVGRIFERFYRVDVARSRHTGGNGLGLSIVKHVAEAHGGRVRVESTLGTGSAFTVALPRA